MAQDRHDLGGPGSKRDPVTFPNAPVDAGNARSAEAPMIWVPVAFFNARLPPDMVMVVVRIEDGGQAPPARAQRIFDRFRDGGVDDGSVSALRIVGQIDVIVGENGDLNDFQVRHGESIHWLGRACTG